jgi:surfeit locus 1 family protein
MVQALMVLPALALLIGLGVWQVERLAWKEALIASINEEIHKPPLALEQPADAWRTLGSEEYRPVSVSGRFRHGDERHVLAVEDGETGWHVYTPLETQGGKLLFVNRGFVPDTLKDPSTRKAGEIEGQVSLTGLVRKPGVQGMFEPDADRVRNVWYWRDLKGMTASLGSDADEARVLPFFVDAAAEPANPGGWPKGGVTRIDIPNRHLEYALTWFGLAAALVAVFGVFAWNRVRGTSPTLPDA